MPTVIFMETRCSEETLLSVPQDAAGAAAADGRFTQLAESAAVHA